MHGHKKNADWWLNWSDNQPEKVKEWVEEQYSCAMDKWYDQENRREIKQQKEIEKQERELFEELKKKYGEQK